MFFSVTREVPSLVMTWFSATHFDEMGEREGEEYTQAHAGWSINISVRQDHAHMPFFSPQFKQADGLAASSHATCGNSSTVS